MKVVRAQKQENCTVISEKRSWNSTSTMQAYFELVK